jgi:hypothetical protein
MSILLSLLLLMSLCFTGLYAQESPGPENLDRETIPEFLRQPQRGEASRYPADMVIGSLERGDVPVAAYVFAREVLAALVTENGDAPVLSSMNDTEREKVFSDLEGIDPRKYRLGNGREEADGAVSFLIRFMGPEKGIAGELYVRAVEPPAVELQSGSPAETPAEAPAGDETWDVPESAEVPVTAGETSGTASRGSPPGQQDGGVVWQIDDIILEEGRSLDEVIEGPFFDLPPYERFF